MILITGESRNALRIENLTESMVKLWIFTPVTIVKVTWSVPKRYVSTTLIVCISWLSLPNVAVPFYVSYYAFRGHLLFGKVLQIF